MIRTKLALIVTLMSLVFTGFAKEQAHAAGTGRRAYDCPV